MDVLFLLLRSHRCVAACVVAMAALLVGCGDDGDRADEARDTTTTAPDRATTTTTEPRRPAGDDVAVAVTDDGRAVVLDVETGEERQVLLEGIRVDDPAANHVAMSAGADEAYVSRPGAPTEDPEIVRVPLAGGDAEVVAAGRAPAISPDGGTLAYVVLEGERPPEPVLVLHDLETGQERQLRRESEPGFYGIHGLTWTADGAAVAFTAGEINLGAYLVDADATSLDSARRLGPVARGEQASWMALAVLDDDRLAVAEACCDVPREERWLVLAVNVRQRAVEGALLPEERVEATWLDGDGKGRLLVVVRGDDPPLGSSLLRWDGSGELREVADGIVVAAW